MKECRCDYGIFIIRRAEDDKRETGSLFMKNEEEVYEKMEPYVFGRNDGGFVRGLWKRFANGF